MHADTTTVRTSGPSGEKIAGILAVLAVILVFLFPLKFGIMTALPEVPFPLSADLFSLLIMFWTPMLFPVFSALLLLAVVICLPPPSPEPLRKLLLPLSWILLFISVIPGFVNASTLDFPIIQMAVFAGTASFAIAVYRLIKVRPDIQIWLINAIILSTLLTVFLGLNQYLNGFKETLAYAHQMEQKTGMKISYSMMNRLQQTRVFSTFSICNSFAAHLILTIPLCIWGILTSRLILRSVIITTAILLFWEFLPFDAGMLILFPLTFIMLVSIVLTIFNFPEKRFRHIAILLLVPLLSLLLFILYTTSSRAAFLALGIAIFFCVMIFPVKLKFRLMFAFFVAGASIFVVTGDMATRGLSSMQVRFDYYLRAFDIFLSHPFLGTGWGDFFHEYTRLKQFPGTEAPHTPHNFIMSFASQAGIAGLAASIFVAVVPFYILIGNLRCLTKNRDTSDGNKMKWLNIAVGTGWCAWILHSMADLNIQVPGTVATAITMLMIINAFPSHDTDTPPDGDIAGKKKTSLIIWYGTAPVIAIFALVTGLHQLNFDTVQATFMQRCNQAAMPDSRKRLTRTELENLLYKTTEYARYSPFPWMTAAEYAKQQGNWSAMEMYCRKAIEKSPERASLYYDLSVAQSNLGKKLEALKNLKHAAKLFPNHYNDPYEALKANH